MFCSMKASKVTIIFRRIVMVERAPKCIVSLGLCYQSDPFFGRIVKVK